MSHIAPNSKNYTIPKGNVLFRAKGEAGYLHLGNCPGASLTPEKETVDHFSSMAGVKEKDASYTTQITPKGSLTLDEINAENLAIAFSAGAAVKREVVASTVSGSELAVVADRYVELGAMSPRILRCALSDVSGTFDVGETVTGGTSSATAKIAYVSGTLMECVSVSGTFNAGETLTGGTSSATAKAATTALVEDIVAVDDGAAPTKRYVQGTDYILLPTDGLFSALSGGAITSKCDVSYDIPGVAVWDLKPFTDDDFEGELLVSGTGDIGTRVTWKAHRAKLKMSGEMAFVGDDTVSYTLDVELLADRLNHPDSPFCEMTVK